MFEWSIFFRYVPALITATAVTVELLVASTLIATFLALVFALLKRSTLRFVNRAINLYIWVFRGLPPLVVLFIFYFGLGALGLKLSSMQAAIIGMSLIGSAYYAEIIKAGLDSVEVGQIEAGKALGLSGRRILSRVIFPQALPVIFPPYISNLIQNLKDTSLASAIAVVEVVGMAKRLVASTMHPIEIFTIVAVIFVVLGTLLVKIQFWLEKQLAMP